MRLEHTHLYLLIRTMSPVSVPRSATIILPSGDHAKRKIVSDVKFVNYTKNPNQFTALMGMARGLSANGEYAKALEFANKALSSAPNDSSKQAVQAMLEMLRAGTDINFGQ